MADNVIENPNVLAETLPIEEETSSKRELSTELAKIAVNAIPTPPLPANIRCRKPKVLEEHKCPPEKIRYCPQYSYKCPICRLPVEWIHQIHHFKYNERWTNIKLRAFTKEHCGRSPAWNDFRDHFIVHAVHPAVAAAKEIPIETVILGFEREISGRLTTKADAELDKAYYVLIDMASKFTKNTEKIFSKLEDLMRDETKLDDELKKSTAIGAMNLLSKLQREAASQIVTLATLRAPKILIAEFLEDAINDLIHSAGFVINDILKDVRDSLLQDLTRAGLNTDVAVQTFSNIFRMGAVKYKEKMVALRKEHLTKASSTLKNMEKII